MHITITGILALFLFFSATPVHAQRWKEQIRAMLSPAPDAPGHRVSLDMPGNPERREAIVFLSAFLTDSTYMVRARALEVSTAIALQTRDTITRQMCVRMLMHPVEGGDFDVAGSALSLLRGFARTDFSTEVRDTISSLIRKRASNLNQLIAMAGYLGIPELTRDLRSYALPGNPNSTRWAALLALARMGDRDATDDVLQRVEALGVTDKVVYNIFPDLVYTRQPEAIAYMAKQIQHDEKHCFSADAEREVAIPCAYRILEQLAPVIENFPLERDVTGDLRTNDYHAALELAREWFKNNNTYRIKDDDY